jgi:hypothetical protein
MSQFMCDKCLAITARQIVISPAEKDVLPGCEGPRLQDPVELVGLSIGVEADPAEVSAHGLLHGGPDVLGEGLASSPCLLDGLLHRGVGRAVVGAVHALDGRHPSGALRRLVVGVGSGGVADDPLGHPVGFALVAVADWADYKLGPDDRCPARAADKSLHVAVAMCALQLEQDAAQAGRGAGVCLAATYGRPGARAGGRLDGGGELMVAHRTHGMPPGLEV